jgi:2-oxoglutarate ferredoxin oxidoreductase subunit alpha
MVRTRADKIARAADEIPLLSVNGPIDGALLVLSWGSTFGAAADAVARCHRKGMSVAHAHLRHLHPLPKNTGDVVKRYRRVLVPELNAGQLCQVVRATFLVDAMGLNKVQGRAFLVCEIEQKIEEILSAG